MVSGFRNGRVSLLEVVLPSGASRARRARLARTGKGVAAALCAAVVLTVGFTAAVTGVWLLLLVALLSWVVSETWVQLSRYAAAPSGAVGDLSSCEPLAHVYVLPSRRS